MHKLEITAKEREKLEDHYKSYRIKLISQKAQCILMRSKGLKEKDIADLLLNSERTIQRWINEFEKYRLASIFSFKLENENASKLTREQKEEVREVLKHPLQEDEAGYLPKRFWDVPTLRKYIEAEFNVVYESKQSYHYLLKFSDLSFKLPDVKHINRNEGLILKRKEEIKLEAKRYLDKNNWEVFCADETRLEEKSLTRRAWIKKNEKTVVKVTMEHEHQSYVGFLNQRDFKCNLFEIEKGNQKEMIRSIRLLKLYYPKKKLCIIWDNAKFHKGEEIKKELKVGGKLENVYFIALPPYAPELNPIEHVWNTAKSEIFKLRVKEGFEGLKRSFRTFITATKFNYEI